MGLKQMAPNYPTIWETMDQNHQRLRLLRFAGVRVAIISMVDGIVGDIVKLEAVAQ